MLAFLDYANTVVKGKNELEIADPNTVQRYAGQVIQAHGRLVPRIDVSFLRSTVARWTRGANRRKTAAMGALKRSKKRAVTRSLMKKIYDLNWPDYFPGRWGPEEEMNRLDCVLRAAAQTGFSCMFRRSEYTRKRKQFNKEKHLTRASFRWMDVDLEFVELSRESLLDIKERGGAVLVKPPVTKSDQNGDIYRDCEIPLAIQPDSHVLKAANYLLDMELNDPIFDMDRRATTPAFVDPRTGNQLSTSVLDYTFIKLLCVIFAPMTEAEVRLLWSLHSLRAGGKNALEHKDIPEEHQGVLGRWKDRDAMRGYSRVIAHLKMYLEYTNRMESEPIPVTMSNNPVSGGSRSSILGKSSELGSKESSDGHLATEDDGDSRIHHNEIGELDVDQLIEDSGVLESLEIPTLSADRENGESVEQDDLFAGAWICNPKRMEAIRSVLGKNTDFVRGSVVMMKNSDGSILKGVCQGIRTFGGAFGEASYGRVQWDDGLIDDVLIPEI